MPMGEKPNLDLLITGFGPFPGMKRNPSTRLALALGRDRAWARRGLKVRAEILPVAYGLVQNRLAGLAAAPPSALLMFGVAGRAKSLRIERLARNRVSTRAPDAGRSRPDIAALTLGGPALRPARAPIQALCQAASKARLPVRLSHDAGSYVCNAAYWHALRLLPAPTRVVFVHIPRLREATRPKPASRPDFATLLRAGRAIAARLLLAARST